MSINPDLHHEPVISHKETYVDYVHNRSEHLWVQNINSVLVVFWAGLPNPRLMLTAESSLSRQTSVKKIHFYCESDSNVFMLEISLFLFLCLIEKIIVNIYVNLKVM